MEARSLVLAPRMMIDPCSFPGTFRIMQDILFGSFRLPRCTTPRKLLLDGVV